MKIMHLTSYIYNENLGHPPYALHQMLLSHGHQSHIVALDGNHKGEGIFYIKNYGFHKQVSIVKRWLYSRFVVSNPKYYYMVEPKPNFFIYRSITKSIEKLDIIVIYWNKSYYGSKLIYKLSKYYSARIIFLPIDMAHLTGGCHYSFGCNEYQSECKNCPAVRNVFSFLPYNELSIKTKYLNKINPALIACSSELLKQALSSSIWRNKNIYKVYLPNYEVTNLNNSGEIINHITSLGLRLDTKILVYAVSDANNVRKGVDIFLEVLKLVSIHNKALVKDIIILLAGNNFNNHNTKFDSTGLRYINLGYLNESDLKQLFSISDIFLSTTIEDSGPILINKAIMSGLACLSFDVGVAKDLVINKYNGLKIDNLGSVSDYYHGLLDILSMSRNDINHLKNNSMSISKQITNEVIFKEYIEVFKAELSTSFLYKY